MRGGKIGRQIDAKLDGITFAANSNDKVSAHAGQTPFTSAADRSAVFAARHRGRACACPYIASESVPPQSDGQILGIIDGGFVGLSSL
jgi:hypothetical protein